MKVLIADGVSQMAVDILKDEFDCDVRDKLPAEELLSIIPDYDALIVRSASKVTAEVIAAAKNLKIIGRAGVGVVKAYVGRKDKDLNKLMKYAKLFRVDKIIRNYMEVLL